MLYPQAIGTESSRVSAYKHAGFELLSLTPEEHRVEYSSGDNIDNVVLVKIIST